MLKILRTSYHHRNPKLESPPAMAPDEALLSEQYTITHYSIHNSTQISTRTTAVTTLLGGASPDPTLQQDSNGDTKPPLVILTARSKAANKLISIVEIAKRETASKERPVYQYNKLSHEVVEIPRDDGKRTGAGDGEERSADFETKGSVERSGMKKRTVPVLTVYLSTVPARELRQAYG